MKLHELSPAAGSVKKASARAAATVPATARPPAAATRARRPVPAAAYAPGFEGGQMPLARRLPKRGFNNIFAKPLDAQSTCPL